MFGNILDNFKINKFFKLIDANDYGKNKKASKLFDKPKLRVKIINDLRIVDSITTNFFVETYSAGDIKRLGTIFDEITNDDMLVLMLDKLLEYTKNHQLNLIDNFSSIKNIYVSHCYKNTELDNAIKNKFADLLYQTGKKSLFPTDYIEPFIKNLTSEEKLSIFDSESMIKFVTTYQGKIDYHTCENFINNIIDEHDNEGVKKQIILNSVDIFINGKAINSYLEYVNTYLDKDGIVKILTDKRIINNIDMNKDYYLAKNLITLLNKVDDTNIMSQDNDKTQSIVTKNQLIDVYFKNYKYPHIIINYIKEINEKEKEQISDNTFTALLNSVDYAKKNEDIIKNYYGSNARFVFNALDQYDDKNAKLLEIKANISIEEVMEYAVQNNIDIRTVLTYAKQHNMDLFQDHIAQKYSSDDSYFRELPYTKADLIKYYRGNDSYIFFDKLRLCNDKEKVLLESNNYIDFSLFPYYGNISLDLFKDSFAKKFCNNDSYFKILPNEKFYLIDYYAGKDALIVLKYLKGHRNINDIKAFCQSRGIELFEEQVAKKYSNYYDYFRMLPKDKEYLKKYCDNYDNVLFLDKLLQADDKENFLLQSNFFNINALFEFCADNHLALDLFQEKFAIKFRQNEDYFKRLPKENASLIQFYAGFDENLFLQNLVLVSNKEDILLNSNIHLIYMNKLSNFCQNNGIDLFQKKFAMKFSHLDSYFELLPDDKFFLIDYYTGKDVLIVLRYLKGHRSIDEIITFCQSRGIELFCDFVAEKFSDYDEYFRMLPEDSADLIRYYKGTKEDIFVDKLDLCHNKKSVLLYSNINVNKFIYFCNHYHIDPFDWNSAKRYRFDDSYFRELPPSKADLIKYYAGRNIQLFSNKLMSCNNKINLLFNSKIGTDMKEIEEIYNYAKEYMTPLELKILENYIQINDYNLKNIFKDYILNNMESVTFDTIDNVAEILKRLSTSNASEMLNFRSEIATQLLKSANPIKSLNKIEDIFIKNNIPTVGKIYSCFEILHPNFQGFNFESSMVSPVLKKSSTMNKKLIVFSDLIKSSFGSNNRSVNAYLKNIEIGSKLYERIKLGQIKCDSLDESQKEELITFSKHLSTLYNNTIKGKKENETFTNTGDILTGILELSKKLSPNGTLNYNIGDRVIRMFCGFTGIDTLEQANNYINQKIRTADTRNRKASSSDMILEQGDFIKGIGDITYLRNILQNGSVSKEYLGSSAGSDSTPLDTDVSMIIKADGTIKDKFNETAANSYGPIWFVLKNDDRFITTRTQSEHFDVKNDMSKMEVFYTGVWGSDHYGIRTGFASSEINYIVMDSYDPRVGLEIAMNGFYIPVANKEGKIVFTPDDYDKLREKMNGLSYYNANNYTFSENLVTKETEYLASQIEQSNYETQVKRTKINEIIKKSLEELGLHLKTNINGDLTEGFVELIDTGSTGRGTNKPGDGDFDFMMRLDKSIFSNNTKLNQLKNTLLKNLGKENTEEVINSGDFRLKEVKIDSNTNVDIDITFTEKTDKVSYSTDMALQDRLTNIKNINAEKYKYVVANILLAKEVLKEAEVYKPDRGDIAQGGLGGVGIENWILQNGGSFIEAANSFLEAAEGKSFDEFKVSYRIWDFGDNHLAERRGKYVHDNFVVNNMNEDGYCKMKKVLTEFIKDNKYANEEQTIKYKEYDNNNIDEKTLLKLSKLEVITEQSIDDLQTIVKNKESNKIVSTIATNYGLNSNTTRLIVEDDFAIVYDTIGNKVRIGDLLCSKMNSEVKDNICKALGQLGSNVDLSLLDKQKLQIYNKVMNLNNQVGMNINIGEQHKTI